MSTSMGISTINIMNIMSTMDTRDTSIIITIKRVV